MDSLLVENLSEEHAVECLISLMRKRIRQVVNVCVGRIATFVDAAFCL